MSQLIPDDWTDPRFLPTAYTLALLVFGAVCLFILLFRLRHWRGLPSHTVSSWDIGWLDVCLLFFLLIAWSMLVAPITHKILPLPDKASPSMIAWETAIDGTLLQAGMAGIFFFFWLAQPEEKRRKFSTLHMGFFPVTGCALLYILAFMPPRMGVEQLWTAALKQLADMGISVPMDEQSLVGCFDGSAPTLAYVWLLVLAGFVAPVIEELIFRAGLYRFLKGQMGRGAAIVVSAGLFASLHMNVLVFPTLMMLGIALCLAYEASGNIKVPIAMHALFNLNSILMIALQMPPHS
jgi:uncharacterized protein